MRSSVVCVFWDVASLKMYTTGDSGYVLVRSSMATAPENGDVRDLTREQIESSSTS